ncbi:pyridoxal-dependent decarboxylase [Dactylosporangium sp. NPDC048998]|uniref:pyridoxal-dependent decarboxylase n=1 Tax=Dactylosporangium sp. NPDC048998 TaxID=3363976 RepID=UPI003716654C
MLCARILTPPEEQALDLAHWLDRSVAEAAAWAADFGPAVHPARPAPPGPSVQWIDDETFAAAFEALTDRLRRGRPVFHPRFVVGPERPAHPAAVVGHVAAALAGEDAYPDLAEEVLAQLAAMLGVPGAAGRLAVSSAAAHLDALCVGREARPGQGVAYAAGREGTLGRLCRALGVPGRAVRVDGLGRIDVGALEDAVRDGDIGTVVLTAGAPETGAVDPIHEVIPLRERYGVRVHVDASYGGFFALLAAQRDGRGGVRPEPWAALAACDSIVVDAHRHALQPAGCAAVFFTDPADAAEAGVADPPGGAAVAALWLTFRVLPPTRDGLGRLLAVTRRAATRWAALIRRSPQLVLHQPPELDVVTCLPAVGEVSALDRAVLRMVRDGAAAIADPVYLGTIRLVRERLAARHPGLRIDAAGARIVRAVLLRPETAAAVDVLHRRVELLAAAALRA